MGFRSGGSPRDRAAGWMLLLVRGSLVRFDNGIPGVLQRSAEFGACEQGGVEARRPGHRRAQDAPSNRFGIARWAGPAHPNHPRRESGGPRSQGRRPVVGLLRVRRRTEVDPRETTRMTTAITPMNEKTTARVPSLCPRTAVFPLIPVVVVVL